MQITRRSLLTLLIVPLLAACATAAERPAPPSRTASSSIAVATLAAATAPPATQPPHRYSDQLSAALTMRVSRATHTATLLPDGQVLIAGGFRAEGTSEIAIADAELYDPATNTFRPISPMTEPRSGHTATLLATGEVLLAGGWGPQRRLASAELYDPRTRSFRATAPLAAPRASMTATLLADGRVAIIGGDSARNTPSLAVEVYDPAAQTFAPGGSLSVGRSAHSATLLRDGTILVAGGGAGNDRVLASAEIYDPRTETFTATGAMHAVRYKHAAVLLPTGNVLLVGGSNQNDWTGKYSSTEEYDPATDTFSQTPELQGERFKLPDGVALLRDGTVLVGSGNAQLERYAPASQQFRPTTRLDTTYYYTVLTVLQDGRVLLTGGYDAAIQPTTKAWIYS